MNSKLVIKSILAVSTIALLGACASVEDKAFYGNTEAIAELSLTDVNKTGRLPTGRHGSLLHAAAYAGSVSQINSLVRRGLNVDNRTGGMTPLQIAAQRGYFATSRALVEAGADINVGQGTSQNPMLLAAAKGNIDLVIYLAEKGDSKGSKNSNGENAVHIAAKNGYKEGAIKLAQAGFDAASKTSSGETPDQLFAMFEKREAERKAKEAKGSKMWAGLIGASLGAVAGELGGLDSQLTQNLSGSMASAFMDEGSGGLGDIAGAMALGVGLAETGKSGFSATNFMSSTNGLGSSNTSGKSSSLLGSLASITGNPSGFDTLGSLGEGGSDLTKALQLGATALDIVSSLETSETPNAPQNRSSEGSQSTSRTSFSSGSNTSSAPASGGVNFTYDCPGDLGGTNTILLPYKDPVCIAAAKEFTLAFACNRVSKMQSAQTAFYSKCAEEIVE